MFSPLLQIVVAMVFNQQPTFKKLNKHSLDLLIDNKYYKKI